MSLGSNGVSSSHKVWVEGQVVDSTRFVCIMPGVSDLKVVSC
jgi:hypothetical protein